MVLISSVLIGCAAHTPAPVSGLNKDYNAIPRGSYRGSFYEVQKGDTLYFISYVTDKNVNDLIRFNNLKNLTPFILVKNSNYGSPITRLLLTVVMV